MLRLLAALAVAVALAAAVVLVPIRGRTVLDRWNAALGPADFAARAWRESRVALGLDGRPGPRSPAARPGGARPPDGRPGAASRPAEQHTEADRAALERIVSERAAR